MEKQTKILFSSKLNKNPTNFFVVQTFTGTPSLPVLARCVWPLIKLPTKPPIVWHTVGGRCKPLLLVLFDGNWGFRRTKFGVDVTSGKFGANTNRPDSVLKMNVGDRTGFGAKVDGPLTAGASPPLLNLWWNFIRSKAAKFSNKSRLLSFLNAV